MKSFFNGIPHIVYLPYKRYLKLSGFVEILCLWCLKTMPGKIKKMGFVEILLAHVRKSRESEKGFDIWSAYMKTWHDFNIDHVQFNVVRSEDMRAAQKEPEKWQHLIVRIAGYSARFLTLPKNAQDAIIARTEQEVG